MSKLPYIPEDLVIDNILTRLPAKSLFGFTSVSKNWHRVITSDSKFAVDQSCNNFSSSSNSKGIVFVDPNCKTIVCLSPLTSYNNPIGIPDPNLHFLSWEKDTKFAILASTNGLVCLTGKSFSCLENKTVTFLHVCNLVTKEGRLIPCSTRIGVEDSIGLAFDPVTSPHHFKLVHPVMNSTANHETEFEFEVFSSGRAHQSWVNSSQKVTLPAMWKNEKPVFAKGILYWLCEEYLLWFDCTDRKSNVAAGYISLPPQGMYVVPEIGVREGHVTCSQMTREGLEVWQLVHDATINIDGTWEMIHRVSLDKMLQEKLTNRLSQRRRRKRKRNSDDSKDEDDSERVLKRLWMCPLPYEGGEKVYLRVKLRPLNEAKEKKNSREWEKLVCFDLKTEAVSEEYLNNKVLLGFSKNVFGYDNNLVPLPELYR